MNPGDWHPDDPLPDRVIFGRRGASSAAKTLMVDTTAFQFSDGRVDSPTPDDPQVHVDTTNWDTGLSSAEARELAAVLIEAADELDRCVG